MKEDKTIEMINSQTAKELKIMLETHHLLKVLFIKFDALRNEK